MPERIAERARRAIEEHVFPGCVVGVVKKNGDREVFPFGNFTYESDSPKVVEDTVYDLASITKSIPTASLALVLVQETRLNLIDKVATYLPELKNHHDATIQDLLTYRVRGVQLSTLKDMTADEIMRHVFERGFDGPAGESQYTNLPAFLLGLVVERVGGDTLDRLAQKYFFDPLEMSHTTFFPIYRPTRSIDAPTEIVDDEEIRGIVHDESARVFARAQRAVGHAGLFSTAPNLLNFLESLLQGTYPPIVEGAQRGLGWQLDQAWFMGTHRSKQTFGKTGFTGTSVVVDRDRGVVFVILSNRTYPKRPPDAASLTSAVNVFRADIADVLLSC